MKPRPKFCVGEEAINTLRGVRVEIVRAKWVPRKGLCESVDGALTLNAVEGWFYQTSETPETMTRERCLRKLPPEERTQWKDCAWQPNNEEVTA